jgi:vacuole morphology and inheritance protein 14
MIDYLPNFLDGLFNMLSDSNREIRQAADSALSDFLKEVRNAVVIEFGPIVPILVNQSLSKDRLNRLTAITWIEELVNHPYSGGDALLPHHSEILGAILYCISDAEEQICLVAERTNADLLLLVKTTEADFQLAPLLETLTEKITPKDDVPTTMACLRWINMLLEKRRKDMTEFVPKLLPVLLMTLSDANDADAVVLFTLQVLARISLGDGGGPLMDEQQGQYNVDEKQHHDNNTSTNKNNIHGGILRGQKDEKHFKLVINAILQLFASDRILLENRGSLVVRKLCVLLDAESVYMLMARVLSSSFELPGGITTSSVVSKEGNAVSDKPSSVEGDDTTTTTTKFSIEFVSTMVQTLNLILLTANELHGLRVLLANAFDLNDDSMLDKPVDEYSGPMNIFESLFRCWCHSPVATFSLCLLARAYGVAFALVQKFSELEVTVGKSFTFTMYLYIILLRVS